jgi:hypothetical protein
MTLHTSEAAASSPETVEITLDEAKTFLADAVKKKGAEHVYKLVENPDSGGETCAYFDPKTKAPSCIVGHVLDRKGITHDTLFARERNLYTDVEGLIDAEIIRVDNETHALLSIAQAKQDDHQPWGKAVEAALKEYEERAEEYEAEGVDDDPSDDYWY